MKWETENIPLDTFMQISLYRLDSNNQPYLGVGIYPTNAINNTIGAPDNMTLNDGYEVINFMVFHRMLMEGILRSM